MSARKYGESQGAASSFLLQVALAYALAVVGQALLLTTLLTKANSLRSPLAIAELFAGMLWIGAIMNVPFIGALSGLWMLARPLRRYARGGFLAFLLSGSIAMHVVWALAHRWAPSQSWFHQPRFITPDGLGQLALLALILIGVFLAGIMILGPGRSRLAIVPATVSIALLLVGNSWNSKIERGHRVYTLEHIRATAQQHQAEPRPAKQTADKRKVLVVGIDCLSWNVLAPLMESGKLPGFAEAINSGAIGYLDNGDESFSPRIWNTIFTGRSIEEHGIHGWTHLVLPRSDAHLQNLLPQTPAIDTFYGLKLLLAYTPNPGLWRLVKNNSQDRNVKELWDVLSDHGKEVVVTNTHTAIPATPVNGIKVVYVDEPEPNSAYPEQLAGEWAKTLNAIGWSDGSSPTVEQQLERSRAMSEFTLDLLRKLDYDLAVHYDMIVDDLAHPYHLFYDDSFFIRKLERSLSDEEWSKLVNDHCDHPVFAGYFEMDRLVQKLLTERNDNLVIVSDHGMTFSGFVHYGSQDGVILMVGPDIKKGVNLSGARIEDVFPTVVQIFGLPLSRELMGRPLVEALHTTPVCQEIASYGPPVRVRSDRERRAVDRKEIDRLRALGYIQ